MRVVGINGSYDKTMHCPSEILLNEAFSVLKTEGRADCETIRLADYNIEICLGCGVCMKGIQCPVIKNPNDDLMTIIEQLYGADGFIFAAPAHHSGGQLFLMTNLWTRLRIVFEKQHSKNWGVELDYISENPFFLKPVANIVTYSNLGAGKSAHDITGRNETGFKYSTIVSLGIHLGTPDENNPAGTLSEYDFLAAKGVGHRLYETISSELCNIFMQIVCGENII